jgi:hypothetical protein
MQHAEPQAATGPQHAVSGARRRGKVRAIHQRHGRDRGIKARVRKAVEPRERGHLIGDAERLLGLARTRRGDHRGRQVDARHPRAAPRQHASPKNPVRALLLARGTGAGRGAGHARSRRRRRDRGGEPAAVQPLRPGPRARAHAPAARRHPPCCTRWRRAASRWHSPPTTAVTRSTATATTISSSIPRGPAHCPSRPPGRRLARRREPDVGRAQGAAGARPHRARRARRPRAVQGARL